MNKEPIVIIAPITISLCLFCLIPILMITIPIKATNPNSKAEDKPGFICLSFFKSFIKLSNKRCKSLNYFIKEISICYVVATTTNRVHNKLSNCCCIFLMRSSSFSEVRFSRMLSTLIGKQKGVNR